MVTYAARVLVHSLVVIWGVLTIVFVILRLLPGDPADLLLGPEAPPEAIAAVNAQLGLDRPIYIQYLTYLWGILRLDFGTSFVLGGSAMGHTLDRMPYTALISLTAMALAVVISVPLGIAAARRPNSFMDKSISALSLFAQSVPQFWIGLMFILLFARTLRLLPAGGANDWKSLILPTITLALPFVGLLVRLVRGSLLEVLDLGYIQTARAKGLSENTVVYKHAFRNTLIPLVTVGGLQLGSILGGAVIVETVFAWPGVGSLLVNSIFNRDFAVVQSTVILLSVIFIMLNLIVDVLYGYLDPRVRLEST